MRILFAGLMHDYGVPERGLSFEYCNLYDSLLGMGHETEFFDTFPLSKTLGSRGMTVQLRERVEEFRPALLFTFLYADEFDPGELRKITEQTGTVTFNWFADDHWRFETYSRHWAPCFTFVGTTDANAIPKYRQTGYQNALLTQWGANTRMYRKGTGPFQHDVTFVGQAHGDRPRIVQALRARGIDVRTMGTHWKVRRRHNYLRRLGVLSDRRYARIVNSTRVTQDRMIEVFQTSRINLNLSGSSQVVQDQIKGRNFEIPACGGFQLSGYANRIGEFFRVDSEIVCYRSVDELVEKVRHYLLHEDERASVAEAGYRRVMEDHTYEKRLADLFGRMGLEDARAGTKGAP